MMSDYDRLDFLLTLLKEEHSLYLIVHGEDDHQFPEDGDEVQEQVDAVPEKQKV